MDIAELDLADTTTFHGWYEAVREVWLEAWPGHPFWATEGVLRELFGDTEDKQRVLYVARDSSGVVAAAGEVGLPQKDNLHVAAIEVSVHPSFRGRGIGRSLLEALEECASSKKRTVLLSNTYGRVATLASRDARFATAAGYQVARSEVRRELELPLRDRDAELKEARESADAAYEFISWWNRCPDELLESRARLSWMLTADEPRGDLDVEAEQFDSERIRRWERDLAKTGRELACTGAVSRLTGELVAVTELGMPRDGEDLAMQFATVVGREHRGHRLGILVKVENLKLAAAHATPPRRVCTWNAEANGPMIRVNEELGFKIAGMAFNWQKTA